MRSILPGPSLGGTPRPAGSRQTWMASDGSVTLRHVDRETGPEPPLTGPVTPPRKPAPTGPLVPAQSAGTTASRAQPDRTPPDPARPEPADAAGSAAAGGQDPGSSTAAGSQDPGSGTAAGGQDPGSAAAPGGPSAEDIVLDNSPLADTKPGVGLGDSASGDSELEDTAPGETVPPEPEPVPDPAPEPARPPAVPAASAAQPFVPPRGRSAAALSADPRIPVWIRRAIVALLAGVVVTIFLSWRWGLTAAVVVAIIDTIYQSKAMSPIPADVRATSAQRRTRHRLGLLHTAGFVALHNRAIPGSDSVIDHLLIGPAGVFAIDSERWDRRLPVRTTGAPGTGALYHGPFSQSPRLAHARWESARAAELIGGRLREEIAVSPVMIIYGPTIPWGVATLRGVAVLSGRRVRKYFRARNRATRGEHLGSEDIALIYQTAEQVLPPAR
jgi:Nuclease-related domain